MNRFGASGKQGMKLDRLLRLAGLPETRGARGVVISGLSCDSRQVRPGYLFVAIRGLQADGQAYVPDAAARGAAAVVHDGADPTRPSLPAVRVDDARKAAARLAAAFHGEPASRLKMIGVTGTNGKTTTAHMIRDILRAAELRPGLLGTIQYEVGERRIPASRTTPPPEELHRMLADMLAAGCRAVVMEVSSHALDQRRVDGIDFDVGVFTNLTHDHLDYHGDMETYFEAKRKLFENLGRRVKTAAAAVNLDDPRGAELLACCAPGVRRLGYGFSTDADVRADLQEGSGRDPGCPVETPWGPARLSLPLPGRFNLSNALAALAACGTLGIEPAAAAAALRVMAPVRGRLEPVPNRRGLRIYIDYAHTPDALTNALRALRETGPGRIHVVFGCGGDRDRAKRPLMGAAAAALADRILLTSDNPRSEDPGAICSEIRQGIPPEAAAGCIIDRAAAIAHALETAEPGDVILIAGKGHETAQELADTIRPFDDRQVAKEWVEQA